MSKRTRTALITGSSRGIGRAFAEQFAERGYDVVLVSRSESKLQEIADELEEQFGASTLVIPADLSETDDINAVHESIKEREIQVDVLVNNAGIAGSYGRFHETDVENELTMVDLNVSAVTHLTKLFVKEMASRGNGKILNVASTAAFNPGPFMAVYHATKSYVLVFTEAVAEEVRETGVTVSVICPGRTRTDFLANSGIKEAESNKQEAMSPSEVAEAGYKGLMDGETIIFTSTKQQIEATIAQMLPRRAVREISMRREASRGRTSINK